MSCCWPVPFRLSHFPQAEVRHPSSTVPFGLVEFYTNWQPLSRSFPNVVVSGTCLSLLIRVWGAKLCPYFQVPPPPLTSWIGARWQFIYLTSPIPWLMVVHKCVLCLPLLRLAKRLMPKRSLPQYPYHSASGPHTAKSLCFPFWYTNIVTFSLTQAWHQMWCPNSHSVLSFSLAYIFEGGLFKNIPLHKVQKRITNTTEDYILTLTPFYRL